MSVTVSASQRRKETAIILACIADAALLCVFLLIVILSGSLTLLSELLRGVPMLVIEVYTGWLLWSVHRDRLNSFQFGLGKLEQFVWLLIGLGFLLSSLWLMSQITSALLGEIAQASPLGLALAASANAINLLINFLAWQAMRNAREEDDSEIFNAQLRARTIKLTTSLILQVTLTIAALSRDAYIALMMDSVGASLVMGLMLWRGSLMLKSSLPVLLDAPIAKKLNDRVVEAAQSALPHKLTLANIRTRRAGQFPHVEITLHSAEHLSMEQVKAHCRELRAKVTGSVGHLDLSITLDESAAD